jgi:hypothetical protein
VTIAAIDANRFSFFLQAASDVRCSASRGQPSSTKSSTALPRYPLDYVVFPSGIEIDLDMEEDVMGGAQRILEDHVSRVWDEQNAANQQPLNNTSVAVSMSQSFARRHPNVDGFVPSSLNASAASLGSSSYSRFVNNLSSASMRGHCSRRSMTGHVMGWSSSSSSFADADVSSRPHFHSTPKSKVRQPYLTSQSDSEMLDDYGMTTTYGGVPTEDVFRRPNSVSRSSSVNAINRGSSQGSCEPQFHSQPNLPESVDDRSVNCSAATCYWVGF